MAPAWGARESSRSARSGGQDYTTQGIPDLKTGPSPRACYVAAVSQPLQLHCPRSLHSKPHWPHSAAQMHQAPPTLEPAAKCCSLCLECSSPRSSHSCLLLGGSVSPSDHLHTELLPLSLFSRVLCSPDSPSSILAVPLPGCVTLRKLLNLSVSVSSLILAQSYYLLQSCYKELLSFMHAWHIASTCVTLILLILTLSRYSTRNQIFLLYFFDYHFSWSPSLAVAPHDSLGSSQCTQHLTHANPVEGTTEVRKTS